MSQEHSGVDGKGEEVANVLYALAASLVRRMPRDVSLTTAATLNTLERHGPQRLTRLAAIEGVSQPSMTLLVTRLEQDGLAERRADPTDGRVVLVALTGAGERYVRRRRRAGAAGLTRLIAELPPDHARALRAALPALVGLRSLDSRDRAARDGAPGPAGDRG